MIINILLIIIIGSVLGSLLVALSESLLEWSIDNFYETFNLYLSSFIVIFSATAFFVFVMALLYRYCIIKF